MIRKTDYTILILLLTATLLMSCTSPAETPEPPTVVDDTPELPQEEIIEQPVPEPIPEEESGPEPEEEPVLQPAPEEPEPEEPSIAEQYLALAKENIKYYVLSIEHPDFGEMHVWRFPDHTKYTFREKYGEIENSKIVPSEYHVGFENAKEKLEDEMRDGNETLVDYIWHFESKYYGCAIGGGSYFYTSDNCYDNLENTEKVIYEGFSFDNHPKQPEDWLMDFIDEEPVKINENRRVTKYTEAPQSVDELFYDNGDGTQTLLHAHSTYGIPVVVEIVKDGKVTKRYLFEGLSINSAGGYQYYPAFTDP